MKNYIKEDYQKVIQVSWRFYPEQVEFVKKRAKIEGISEGEFIRNLLQERIEEVNEVSQLKNK